MILADTSAWIEYLRQTESSVDLALNDALAAEQVATTDPVIMEVLAGSRSEAAAEKLLGTLETLEYYPTAFRTDWERAAQIYRECRRAGVTIRSQVDCLIAAVAERRGVPVLHADADFARLAEVAGIAVVALE
jgi:predicted nucleic acid-binding protein